MAWDVALNRGRTGKMLCYILMHIFNIMGVSPLLSFNVIITRAMFSYVICASEGYFSLFKRSSTNASSSCRLDNPTLVQN